MNIIKNITGQLALGGIAIIVAILFFSVYSFIKINNISSTEAGINTIEKIPHLFFELQSSFLAESKLLFQLHHNFISPDDFIFQLEKIDSQERIALEELKTLNEQFKNIDFLNEKERLFAEEFEYTLETIDTKVEIIEEQLKETTTLHILGDESREELIQNEINKIENELENNMTSLSSDMNFFLNQRNAHINEVTSQLIRNSFFFISFTFVLIVTLISHLYIQITFSLKTILKGITESKQTNNTNPIELYTENEFGVIAESLNSANNIIAEKENELNKRIEETEKQAQSLVEKNDYLERFRKVTVNRELKMIELKKEIEELKKKNDLS